MYNCYCDLPIWDWFKQQPKSYFEGIIREGGLVDARSEAKMTTRDEEWKLFHAPCNTSEKLVLREVIRHYIESVAKSKVVRIEVVNHLGAVKKFGVTEFINSVKNMTSSGFSAKHWNNSTMNTLKKFGEIIGIDRIGKWRTYETQKVS